jgi:hypothetical protein
MTTKKTALKERASEENACGLDEDSSGRKAVGVDPSIKASNLRRLRRIEGQVRGLQWMVEEDRYCATFSRRSLRRRRPSVQSLVR